MSVRSFFDTNILIHADDKGSLAKQRRALELVGQHRRDRTGALSIQVLQEYFVVATRKLGLEAAIARRKVELLAELDVVVPELSDVLGAIDLHRLHQIPFWDALILQAAKQAGCKVLYSEDSQAGKTIDGILIRNPFN
jgi:predicted nucleic acid-binding protein